MAEQRKKLRLGELLVQQGLITTDQLSIALAEQRHNNIPIGRLLVRLGFVTESAIRDIMARTIGQESIDLSQVVADPEALRLVPQEFARRNRMLQQRGHAAGYGAPPYELFERERRPARAAQAQECAVRRR